MPVSRRSDNRNLADDVGIMMMSKLNDEGSAVVGQELRGNPVPETAAAARPDLFDVQIDLLERCREQLTKKTSVWELKLEELDQKIEALKSERGAMGEAGRAEPGSLQGETDVAAGPKTEIY